MTNINCPKIVGCTFSRSGDDAASMQGNYQHYSGKEPDDKHTPYLVPQSMMEGWQCFCSCGRWYGFASYYQFDTKEKLLGALRKIHQEHRGAEGLHGTVQAKDEPK